MNYWQRNSSFRHRAAMRERKIHCDTRTVGQFEYTQVIFSVVQR